MVEKWDITIPELTGSETRRAYLYLPDYYDNRIFINIIHHFFQID